MSAFCLISQNVIPESLSAHKRKSEKHHQLSHKEPALGQFLQCKWSLERKPSEITFISCAKLDGLSFCRLKSIPEFLKGCAFLFSPNVFYVHFQSIFLVLSIRDSIFHLSREIHFILRYLIWFPHSRKFSHSCIAFFIHIIGKNFKNRLPRSWSQVLFVLLFTLLNLLLYFKISRRHFYVLILIYYRPVYITF